MQNMQHEYDFELEQQRLTATAASADASSSDGTSPPRLAAGAASRQAVFASELEAAAMGGAAAGETEQPPQQPELPTFAAVLAAFLSAAAQRRGELEAASQQTSELVRETVAWLGEAGADQEAAVFELLYNFSAGFDHCAKKVWRQLAPAAASGAMARR